MIDHPRDKGPADFDRLLADLYSNGWDAAEASRMARRGARLTRRRRMARRALPVAATLVLMLVIAIVVVGPPERQSPLSAPPDSDVSQLPYQTLTDSELMTILRDTPVLVLRERGNVASVVWLETPFNGEAMP